MLNVEIFSCSGGMAEGFRRAGITFDLVVDASPHAVESYAANLGHRPVCMDARDFRRLVELGVRSSVRLLVADPPCTPWSTAGKRRGLDDERDMLRETCEIIALLRPEAFLIGNVPGLEMGPNVGALQTTIGALAEHGYCVRDAVVLDAANYGVPQHRVRPFWYGHRAGPCIRWPAPTHGCPRDLGLPGMELLPWVTVRAALQHLPEADLGRVVHGRAREQEKKPSHPSHPSRTLTARGRNDYAERFGTDLPQSAREMDADSPAPAIQALECRNARASSVLDYDAPATTVYAGTPQLAAPGKGSPMSRSWPWDRPATAVCADERLEPPGHHEPSSKTVGGYVRLSERAGLILQGFPETWQLRAKTKGARWSMLGQAMPPPLAEAVARSVREQMERADALRIEKAS